MTSEQDYPSGARHWAGSAADQKLKELEARIEKLETTKVYVWNVSHEGPRQSEYIPTYTMQRGDEPTPYIPTVGADHNVVDIAKVRGPRRKSAPDNTVYLEGTEPWTWEYEAEQRLKEIEAMEDENRKLKFLLHALVAAYKHPALIETLAKSESEEP